MLFRSRVESPSGWEQTVDEWGQSSWRNASTGELSWVRPNQFGPKLDQENKFYSPDPVGHEEHPEEMPAIERTPEHQSKSLNTSITSLNNDSSSSDELAPMSYDDARFFSEREERYQLRLKRRKHTASISARKALAFLEETAASKAEHEGRSLDADDVEDDAPAFVDAQALRTLAAGNDGWKYVSRKQRRAARVRAEALRIANEKEAKMAEEVVSSVSFNLKMQISHHITGSSCRGTADLGATA